MDYAKQIKEFTRSSHFVKPYKSHPKENRFQCNQCDRICSSISALRFHQRSHNEKKLNESHVTKHKRTPHEGKTFQINDCFSNNSQLTK